MPVAFVPVTIHDRAGVTITGGVIPAGSSVTFRFYANETCTGPYEAETVAITTGSATASVESSSRLITTLTPIAYRAVFNSGDGTLVGSVLSDCEPMTFVQGPPPPASGNPVQSDNTKIVMEFTL